MTPFELPLEFHSDRTAANKLARQLGIGPQVSRFFRRLNDPLNRHTAREVLENAFDELRTRRVPNNDLRRRLFNALVDYNNELDRAPLLSLLEECKPAAPSRRPLTGKASAPKRRAA